MKNATRYRAVSVEYDVPNRRLLFKTNWQQ